jgi:hypothetical protein
MPEENILPNMKPVVLAKNDPAIIGVFPHVRLRHPSERVNGWKAISPAWQTSAEVVSEPMLNGTAPLTPGSLAHIYAGRF